MSMRTCVQKLLFTLAGKNAAGTWIGLIASVHNAGRGLWGVRSVKPGWDAHRDACHPASVPLALCPKVSGCSKNSQADDVLEWS